MSSNPQRPTPVNPLRRYGKIAALVLIPVLVVAIAAVAIIGPSRVATIANQVNRMGGASAGNLASFSGARDIRFGIAEGAKHPDTKATGIGWERQTFSWSGIQPNGPDDWNADFYAGWLQGELDTGVQVVGLLQFTPGWARANPGVEQRSLPQNLNLPYNDSNNYWGRYTRRIAEHYKGRINHWVIWNEPEIRPTDAGAGSAWTFDGGPEEYAQLLKVAYRNIKEANPDATVVFAGTAYWLDKNSGREQFFKRVLDVIANDPEAAANNWYFDAVAYNIYYGADTIYRVGLETRAIMAARGINKEMWLTETNAPPSDPGVPCADRFAANPSSVSLDVHSNYAMQSMAMALAGGWNRAEWYQSTDSGSCNESAIWGLLRDDGSRRPAFDSFSNAIRQLSGVGNITFMPYEREGERWGQPWPYNPDSYFPNYQVYQVVGDRGDQRISVLWNADGAPLQVRIPRQGSSAVLIDQFGGETPLSDNGGWYMVDLPQATARSVSDPDGYYYIGGQTRIIVQSGVPGGTAMLPPALGAPGSQPREFRVSVSPENGQKISAGQSTQFTLRMRSFEGFGDPVSISVQEYSNAGNRTPTGLPGYITLDMPASVQPNGRVDIQVHMAPDAPSNLHFMTLKLEGGGVTKTVDLVVEVP